MNNRVWQISEIDKNICDKIIAENGVMPITAKLLANRGLIEKADIENFFNRDGMPLHDPFLLKDMD